MTDTGDVLDLAPWVGQRAHSFLFELLDGNTGRVIREVTPSRDSAPTLSHDVSRAIKRELSPVVFDEQDSAVVDPVSQRLRVTMLLETGERYPLGVFVFTDATASLASRGTRDDTSLMDSGFILDQPVQQTVSFPRAANITDALTAVVEELSQTARAQLSTSSGGTTWYPAGPLDMVVEVEGSTALAGSALSWGAGTNGMTVIEDLAMFGGWFSPWVDASNRFRAVLAFDPADRVPTFDYDTYPQMVRDQIALSDDLLSAPNRFIVIDNSNTAFPVVGVYDVPPSAPHSIQRRGFVVATVTDVQGIGAGVQTGVSAAEAARAVGLQRTLYQRLAFSTPVDPRHDAYDVIRFQGANWLETAWTISLAPGGMMTHVIQRAYQAETVGTA